MNDLVRRQKALEATRAKFRGKPFDLGRFDCIKVARFHLDAMGHSGLPPTGTYSTPLGARRALGKAIERVTGKRARKPTLAQLADALLERIAPAAMLPGDIALIEEDPEGGVGLGGTIVVSVGRKWLNWHPDAEGFAVIDPNVERPFLAAWRA